MTTPELPPVAETALPTSTGRKVNWGFWVWVGCSLVLTLGVVVVGTAWAVRHTLTSGQRLSDAQQEAALAVASFPGTVRDAVQEFMWQFSVDPEPLLMDRASTEKPYWVRHFPEPSDTGYLLFSGSDAKAKQSIVELIRISDGKSIARWVPDWDYILSNARLPDGADIPEIKKQRAIHPLLASNGDIIFNTGIFLVRMGLCSTKPIWQVNKPHHHSNEFDPNGNIISPSKFDVEIPIPKRSARKWENDSISTISPDGIVIHNISFAKILIDNDMKALLVGQAGWDNKGTDPIHMNEIKPALTDSKFWRKGDLLISARHLSTVFLYRPSTSKIIWYQTGPWINQHSVDFVGDHQISVFNNNVVLWVPTSFISSSDHNEVMLFDFSTGKVTEPYRDLLNQAKPRTITEGRAMVLPDGELFIEETNFGRQMLFKDGRLLWSRVNDFPDGRVGILAWSRYLTENEARSALNAIESNSCVNHR